MLSVHSLSRILCIHHRHHQALIMQTSHISTYKFLEVHSQKNYVPMSRYEQAQLDSIMEISPARAKYQETNPWIRMDRLLVGAKHRHCVLSGTFPCALQSKVQSIREATRVWRANLVQTFCSR